MSAFVLPHKLMIYPNPCLIIYRFEVKENSSFSRLKLKGSFVPAALVETCIAQPTASRLRGKRDFDKVGPIADFRWRLNLCSIVKAELPLPIEILPGFTSKFWRGMIGRMLRIEPWS